MKIKLLAFAPRDAWGFIKNNGKIYSLRPPYLASNIVEVSEHIVKTALHTPGFEECDKDFISINEIIQFIKEKYIDAKQTAGVDLPTSEELKELLKYATDDILLDYLTKSMTDLIPKGQFDVAETIAIELLKLERVRDNLVMCDLAIDIIDQCRMEKKRNKELEMEISKENEKTWEIRFPYAAQVYTIEDMSECQKSISRKGQLLEIGK